MRASRSYCNGSLLDPVHRDEIVELNAFFVGGALYVELMKLFCYPKYAERLQREKEMRVHFRGNRIFD